MKTQNLLDGTSRRAFLRGAASLGVFSIVPAKVLHAATAPSNQLTHALIGYGQIGQHWTHFGETSSRLIGVCDPYEARVQDCLRRAQAEGKGKIRPYGNFLELLDDPGLDIVHICTPPHWHGCMSVMAAKAGKDIWCEKPMTRTIGEGKRVAEVVKATGRIFRINTWFRFMGDFYAFGSQVKPLRQLVENGVLGKGPIKCVVGEGQGFSWKSSWTGRVNLESEPIPAGFDWDMWLGPAPWKPYNSHRAGTSFRGYWDYDAGGLGDMAQHYLDPIQYVLDKDETSPVKVDYLGPKQHPEAVGAFDRFTLTYADGAEIILDGNGSLKDEPLLRGSNGYCVYKKAPKGKTFRLTDGSGKELDVEKVLADLPEPKKQETNFADCCRRRVPFALNETNGFRSCTIHNLCVVAQRLGRGFEFDPVKLVAPQDEAANRFICQPLREPWQKEMFG